MNSTVLQRILGGKKDDPKGPQRGKTGQTPLESPIVPPEVLREKLVEKLNPKPIIVLDEKSPPPSIGNPVKLELVHFSSLFEWAHWYENNKTLFNEQQIKPLETLIEARNITLGGCNCDREKRKFIANDYFKKFWINNRATDILPTLQKALNTKKIIFGDFLSFPG
jgi:hypothetical protein